MININHIIFSDNEKTYDEMEDDMIIRNYYILKVLKKLIAKNKDNKKLKKIYNSILKKMLEGCFEDYFGDRNPNIDELINELKKDI